MRMTEDEVVSTERAKSNLVKSNAASRELFLPTPFMWENNRSQGFHTVRMENAIVNAPMFAL